jgi:hypothetical protein
MAPTEYEPRAPSYRELLAAYARTREAWERSPTMHGFALLQTGLEILNRELEKPGRFPLGALVMTPGALDALLASSQVPPEFLLPHQHGDWGELGPEDRRENERALLFGGRVFSAYRTRTAAKLWVITEWDRSATTLLLPQEY